MFERVPYASLNARQQENHNFHKVASRLADYGYSSMRLTDDFEGADFIALHVDGETILRVQLKGRFTLSKRYVGKGIHIAFREGARVFVYLHDELLQQVLALGRLRRTVSWDERRHYDWRRPPAWAAELLVGHEV